MTQIIKYKRPLRPQLDPDNRDYVERLSEEHGISLTEAVNRILRGHPGIPSLDEPEEEDAWEEGDEEEKN